MRRTRIAILGGGPKAAAIAAKAWCLREAELADIDVTIFEPSGIGSAWRGEHGFTTGAIRLCTSIDRDLGFPYRSFSTAVDEMMIARFSWQAYRVSERPGGYAAWVDDGRPFPTHKQFADYLDFAVRRADTCSRIVDAPVTALTPGHGGKWEVVDGRGGRTEADAVVVTGTPDPVVRDLGAGGDMVFDGKSFWRPTDPGDPSSAPCSDASLKRFDQEDVFVIGTGGTAASVVARLLNAPADMVVHVVGKSVPFSVRTANPLENAIGSMGRPAPESGATDAYGPDPAREAWDGISNGAKRDLIRRLTRGFIWDHVAHGMISPDNRLRFVGGAVTALERRGSASEVVVHPTATPDDTRVRRAAELVVDARGFDQLWFRRLLPDDEGLPHDGSRSSDELVDSSFRLKSPFPHLGLHVPNLGTLHHPVAGLLLALGAVADMVLAPYVVG